MKKHQKHTNYVGLKVYKELKTTTIHSKDIDIDWAVKEYCDFLDKNKKVQQNIPSNSHQEFPFLITLQNFNFFYIIEKQDVTFEYTDRNYLENAFQLSPRKFRFGKYDINISINCNERKDERGKRYSLDITS